MDLLTLTAKLTLNKTAYDTALENAEKSANAFTGPKSPTLTMNTTGFMIGAQGAIDKTGEVNDALEETKEIYKFGDITGGIWDGIKDSITVSGVVAAISSVTAELAKCVGMAGSYGDSVDKGAAKLGISTQAYQQWNYALSMSGANVNNLTSGVKKLNSWLQETNGEGLEETGEDAEEAAENASKVAEAMEKLGISAKDSNGNLKSTEQILDETVMALAGMEEGSERNDLAAKIFGSSGALNALLNSGTSGIEGLLEEADNLGLVMSEDAVKNAAAYEDALSKLQTEIEAVRQSFGEGLLPILTEAVNGVREIVSFFNLRLHKSDEGIEGELNAIDEQASDTEAAIAGTAAQATAYIDKLIELSDKTEKTAAEHAQWKKAAEWLVKNIPSLASKIDLEKEAIVGENDELKENVKQWENRQKQMALQDAVSAKYQALAKKAAEATDAEITAMEKAAEAEGKRGEAIDKANQIIEKSPELGEKFGADATIEEIDEFTDSLYGTAYYNEAAELQKLIDANGELQAEANNAQKEADKLNKEYEVASQQVSTYAKIASEKMQLLDTDAEGAETTIKGIKATLDSLPDEKTITVIQKFLGIEDDGSHASGLNYVPYDNYKANLHRGETVLNASQAREYRNSNNSGIDLSALSSSIVSAVQNGMANATVNSYLDGKKVTSEVNRNTYNQVAARRYAP